MRGNERHGEGAYFKGASDPLMKAERNKVKTAASSSGVKKGRVAGKLSSRRRRHVTDDE